MITTLPALTPVLATAAVGLLYYRRIRRNFGRQPYHPRRALARLVLLTLVAVLLVVVGLLQPHVRAAITIGAVVGIGIAVLALRHAHVEPSPSEAYYTPNPWIGGALSLLLVGRLAWRWSSGAFTGNFAGSMATGQPTSALTLGIAAVLVGYYLFFGIGLRRQLRRPVVAAPDA